MYLFLFSFKVPVLALKILVQIKISRRRTRNLPNQLIADWPRLRKPTRLATTSLQRVLFPAHLTLLCI